MGGFTKLARFFATSLFATSLMLPAQAGEEFLPPSGKGRVVVMLSGQSGTESYRQVAAVVAQLGYDVVLLDTPSLLGTHGKALRDAIAQAQLGPHAMPGKTGLVGFSLGGGLALEYGPAWSDQVAVVVAWYPATGFVIDPIAWSADLRVPVVMFAGEADTYNNCCLVGKARALADLAKSHAAQFELTTYPGVKHGFVLGGANFDAAAFADALSRTRLALAGALSDDHASSP